MLKLSILSLYSMPPPVIPIFIICDMYAQSYGSPIYQNEMDTLPEKDPDAKLLSQPRSTYDCITISG